MSPMGRMTDVTESDETTLGGNGWGAGSGRTNHTVQARCLGDFRRSGSNEDRLNARRNRRRGSGGEGFMNLTHTAGLSLMGWSGGVVLVRKGNCAHQGERRNTKDNCNERAEGSENLHRMVLAYPRSMVLSSCAGVFPINSSVRMCTRPIFTLSIS